MEIKEGVGVLLFVPEVDVLLPITKIIVHIEILIEEGRAECDSRPPAFHRGCRRKHDGVLELRV